jgi:hypothetical protein
MLIGGLVAAGIAWIAASVLVGAALLRRAVGKGPT